MIKLFRMLFLLFFLLFASYFMLRPVRETFGIAGGEPFGLLACDYEVRHRPKVPP